MGIGNETSIVANCSTEAHSPDEIMRKDPHAVDSPYDWARKDR